MLWRSFNNSVNTIRPLGRKFIYTKIEHFVLLIKMNVYTAFYSDLSHFYLVPANASMFFFDVSLY